MKNIAALFFAAQFARPLACSIENLME